MLKKKWLNDELAISMHPKDWLQTVHSDPANSWEVPIDVGKTCKTPPWFHGFQALLAALTREPHHSFSGDQSSMNMDSDRRLGSQKSSFQSLVRHTGGLEHGGRPRNTWFHAGNLRNQLGASGRDWESWTEDKKDGCHFSWVPFRGEFCATILTS